MTAYQDGNNEGLAGRICVVTGANTGIGFVTARELARRGARVVMACRSEERARPALEEIARETGGTVDFLALDLGNLSSVRRSAAELLERGHAIHVLVNNAGIAGSRGLTGDGFEITFGVNHLGPFLFTTLLLDRIVESAPARIVNVSSKSHYQAKTIDWDALRKKTRSVTGLGEYAVSKLANVLFTAELTRRLEGDDVRTYSLHPGVIASDVWRSVPWPARPLIKRFMKSTDDGARTSLHCAASAAAGQETGLYYDSCKPVTPSRLARDADLAAEMWRRSEEFCRDGA